MSVETRKILEMLAAGKITSDDAERLLDKLSATPDVGGIGETVAAANGGTKKFLRVLVEKPGDEDVNVRVPLTFVRSGVRLAGVLPSRVLEKLQAEGLDPKLFTQHVEQSLDELHVDMETKSGKHVRIFCE